MTDILLVKPQGNNIGIQTYPPLGLGFISTYLKKNDYTVHLLDCDLKNIPPSKFCTSVDLDDYQVIGFQLFTINMESVEQYLQVIKEHNAHIVTIVGGPQPASDPIHTLEYLKYADYAVYGEGESSLAEFLKALHNKTLDDPAVKGNIPNLVWRHNNEYRINPLRFEENLDQIGPPDLDGINVKAYDTAVHGFFCKRLPTWPIIITRGCPHRCTFCGGRSITGFKVRTRDPLKVVEEIKLLKNKYGIREFQIIDDCFTANKKTAMLFCKALIDDELNLPWSCPNGTRLDTLDDELLSTMRNSGCYELAVGIESGNQRILNEMKKDVTIELIREKVNLIHKHNINVIGFIMVGYPSETAQTIEDSRRLALELPLLRVSLTRFVPFPGIPVTEELIKQNKIKRDQIDFTKLSYMKFSYVPDGLTKKQLNRLFLKFFISFYARPHILFKNLKGVHSFRHFMLILKKVMNFIFGV
ncbi:MAG: radical SAM protein [Candidatus Omnitrophica bacterium]|nr:radical SAM protein [Candidatus Omnitrophota bacterium]